MSLIDDLRFGLRLLRKNPTFTAAAVLTVVFGVLVNTAVFGVVNALWFGKLPFRDDSQVMVITAANPAKGMAGLVSQTDYLNLSEGSRSFEGWAAFSERTYNIMLSGAGGTDRMRGGTMSASAFEVLGYTSLLGRTFSTEDEAVPDDVVLIGEGLWRNRFGADPGAVGKQIKVNGKSATIVGVLPYSFRFVYAGYQVIAPMPARVDASRGNRNLQVVARLRREATVRQAQAELDAVAARLASENPETNEGWKMRVRPYRQAVFAQAMRMYPVLLAAALLVLLVVCANVSNLLLAKVPARRREMAIRASLGAPRGRLVRQLLSEGALIAFAGGAMALLAATWMRALVVAHYPEMSTFRLDFRVWGYTLAITSMAALVFGLAPALTASGGDTNEALKEGGSRHGASVGRWRGTLIVAQLAFALMLLAGTGMMVRTIATLRTIDTGFDLTNVAITTISLDGDRYSDAQRRETFRVQLRERLAGLAGVDSTAFSSGIPLLSMAAPQRVEVAGRPSKDGGDFARVALTRVDPGYFDTAGLRLIAGRKFGAGDSRAAVVNEAFARMLHSAGPAECLGERIRVGDGGEWMTVVGVARNSRQILIDAPGPEVLAMMTPPPRELTILVKSQTPEGVREMLRQEVRAMDSNLAVGEVLLESDIVEMFYPKVMIGALGVFATIALALAGLGMYGVMSFVVSGTTRELALRLALGATPGMVIRLVVKRALILSGVGMAIGLAGGLALSRVLAGMVYGASRADPLVFGGVAAVLVTVAMAASLVPAVRAARVDPVVALRCE